MLAHLSDLHVLASKRTTSSIDLGTRIVSFGRALDPERRRKKIARAIASAKALGATHFVLTGDLTETGTPEQFEALAEILHEHLTPEDVVLCPGNHDAYASPHAWRAALEGPLAAFRRTAAEEPGKVVAFGDHRILPIDTTFHQRVPRSAGEIEADGVRALAERLADGDLRDRPVILAMHHSPFPHTSRAWHWIDGLQGGERLVELLARFPNVDVLHGHLHFEVARTLGGSRPRVFGTTAVVEDPETTSRVRIHEHRAHPEHRTHEQARSHDGRRAGSLVDLATAPL